MTSYKTKQALDAACALAEQLQEAMLSSGFRRVAIVGSIRREEPEVGDIDIVADGDLPSLASLPGVEWKRGGDESVTFVYHGQQVNISERMW